uniref:RNA helicase n=1 Tax=viral metagenome TaxID=1070528 RepID=A0A6C0EZM8_9ZZZZ
MSAEKDTEMLEDNNNLKEDKFVESNIEEVDSWDELDLKPDILRGIYAHGLEKPSPIQRKAVKPIMDGKDIIAQAQSGTGKTATFTIGALSHVVIENNETQILVLSPTRELSKQTQDVMYGIGSMMPGLRVQLLVGGNSIDDDVRNLKDVTPHIITGTPGRVYDMMRRNNIGSKNIKLIICDEADEMLSSGFKEQVYNIFQFLRRDVQVALFSATLPDHINTITSKFMRNPVTIQVKAEQLTLEGISQYYVAVEDDRQKYLTLKDLYAFMSMSQCIIYCNSVKRVSDLYEAMMEDGFPVCRIHSNMEKFDRDSAFSEFKTGKHRVLISSNVTSRGIDIQQVSCVINFDIPKDVHNYLHRIGRSGRWGRKGVGINLITRRDISKLKEIETYYVCQINELPGNFDSLMR